MVGNGQGFHFSWALVRCSAPNLRNLALQDLFCFYSTLRKTERERKSGTKKKTELNISAATLPVEFVIAVAGYKLIKLFQLLSFDRPNRRPKPGWVYISF